MQTVSFALGNKVAELCIFQKTGSNDFQGFHKWRPKNSVANANIYIQGKKREKHSKTKKVCLPQKNTHFFKMAEILGIGGEFLGIKKRKHKLPFL